jgi:O-antigen/teichoic acid export membrane protein
MMTTERPPSRIATARRHIAATGWGLVGEAVRLPSAIIVFLILTRRFEKNDYGVLVATLSVLMFVMPYATAGSSYLLLQRVAGDGWDATTALARAFGTVLIGGGLFSLGMVALRPLVLPQIPAGTLALLCASEIIAAGLVEAMVFLAQAQERLAVMAALRTVAGISRVIAAVGFVLFTHQPVLEPRRLGPPMWLWAVLVLTCGIVTAIVGQLLMVKQFVVPTRPHKDDVRRGVPFALGFGADKFRDGIDQWLLVRMNRSGDAGIYGSSSRLVSLAAAPIGSIIAATNAKFFQAATVSVFEARRLARRVTAIAFAYALAAAAFFVLASGLIVRILPKSYAETGTAMRLMSVFPALAVLEVFVGMALTAIGRHPARVILNLVTAGLNAVLDIIWIPRYGYRAAIVATIIAGLTYSAALWFTLERACRKSMMAVQQK